MTNIKNIFFFDNMCFKNCIFRATPEFFKKKFSYFLEFFKFEGRASERLSFFLEFFAWVLFLSCSFFARQVLKKRAWITQSPQQCCYSPLFPLADVSQYEKIWHFFSWHWMVSHIVSSFMDLWTQLLTQIFAAFEQLNGFPHSEFIYGSLNQAINSNIRHIWTTEWFLTIVSS